MSSLGVEYGAKYVLEGPATLSKENRLSNGGFESGSIAPWAFTATNFTSVSSSIIEEQFVGSTGQYVARLKGTKDNTATVRALTMVSTTGVGVVIAGNRYSARVVTNVIDALGTGFQIYLNWYKNAVLISTFGISSLKTSTGVVVHELNRIVAPAGANQAQLVLQGASGVALDAFDIMVDSAEFRELGEIAVFNDATDPDFVGIINPESSGLESADVRENGQDATEADGGVNGSVWFGRRPVILQGTVIANSKLQRNERVGKIKRASSAMRNDAVLTWQPEGAASAVELKLRLQQRIAVTKAFVKDFLLPFVSANAFVQSVSVKAVTLMGEVHKAPTVGENISKTGFAWTTPGNIFTENSVFAKASPEGTTTTDELRARKFGFVLPANAEPIGFEGIFVRKGTTVKDGFIQLSTTSGAATGNNKALAGNWPGAKATVIYGGPNDLWGVALTKALVEGEFFGFNARATGTVAGEGVGTAEVDLMFGTIYYASETEPNNEGDTEAFPVVTVSGPASSVTLKNVTTGKELVLTGLGLLKGEKLTIDFSNHTVKKGAVTLFNSVTFPGSTWWGLVPGPNKIEAQATGVSDTSVSGGRPIITMEYRDTFL